MSQRTIAARYARALLDVAIKESDPAKIEQGLAAFVDAVNGHAELKRALTSPGVPPPSKRRVVEAVTKTMALEAPLAKLLALVAERGRIEILPDLLDVYRERLLAHNNIVRASVSAATSLTPEKVQALEKSLEAVTGKDVQLDVAVDPSLIGGVVARIGSTVYDGSIRTQLQKMKQELVENA